MEARLFGGKRRAGRTSAALREEQEKRKERQAQRKKRLEERRQEARENEEVRHERKAYTRRNADDLISTKDLVVTKEMRRLDPPRYRLWELEEMQLEGATLEARGVWLRERKLLIKCLAAYWVFGDNPDIHWLAENKPWVKGGWAGHSRFIKAQLLAEPLMRMPLALLEGQVVALWRQRGLIHESVGHLADANDPIRI